MTREDMKLIEQLKKLPTDYWDFKRDDTKEFTHGIHYYPAMMVCPISRNIISIVKQVRPVQALFDPFCGSGTVLVEGMLAGIETIAGNDINPLALLLSKVKTTPIDHELLTAEATKLIQNVSERRETYAEVLSAVDSYIVDVLGLDLAGKTGWGDEAPKLLERYCAERNVDISVPNFKNLGYWFRPRVILELAIIKSAIENIENKDVRDFMLVAFSETVRLVSNKRRGEFKMFRMPDDEVRRFNPDVYTEFIKVLFRNIDKMKSFCRVLDAINTHSKVSLFRNNACTLEDVPNDTYDLIITSPPYGDSRTTVAYGEFSRLSLQWIGLDGLSDEEIMSVDKSLMGGKRYSDRKFALNSATLAEALNKIENIDMKRAIDVYSFYVDLDAALKSISQKTRSGGYQFWVVGNRTVRNVLLRTDLIITEFAKQYDLTPILIVERNIPKKVMPLRNAPTNVVGATSPTITMEHIVVLRKD